MSVLEGFSMTSGNSCPLDSVRVVVPEDRRDVEEASELAAEALKDDGAAAALLAHSLQARREMKIRNGPS